MLRGFRPALLGDVPKELCRFWHNTFNLHTFRSCEFFGFWNNISILHRANEPIYSVHGNLSESGRKRATRAVTARHMGKKTASQRHLTESSTFGEITAIRWTYIFATQ